MYISVPCCRLHTQRQIGTQTHSFSFILLQRNHCRVQTSHGYSKRVSQSVLTIAVFITPLYNVGVGTKTHPWTPESALAWLDHCRGKRVAVWLQNKRAPRRKKKVWCIPLWSDVRKYWRAAPVKGMKTKYKGTVRPKGLEWRLMCLSKYGMMMALSHFFWYT